MEGRLFDGSLLAGLFVFAACGESILAPTPSVSQSFAGVNVLEIRQAQGKTRIEQSHDNTVSVAYSYSYPESCYRPGITQTGNVLEIHGIFEPVACSGRSDRIIRVPDGVTIGFIGLQADLTMVGIEAEIVAYGRDITAQNLTVSGETELHSIGGDVFVSLDQTANHGLTISSSHGRATLTIARNQLRGRFEFSAMNENQIRSPYPFDEEALYDCECEPGDGRWRWRKAFTSGGVDRPHFTIITRDGTAELELR
jgi:hypothetical protein